MYQLTTGAMVLGNSWSRGYSCRRRQNPSTTWKQIEMWIEFTG